MIIVPKHNINPYKLEQQNPASYDCLLAPGLLKHVSYGKYEKSNNVIPAKSFRLASTVETFSLPYGTAGYVEGKSTIGRLGLFVQNAGFIDPGFHGTITLELFNANDFDITLEDYIRICQIVFFEVKEGGMYNGKYQGQQGVTGAIV